MTNGATEFALDCPKSLLRDLYDAARRSHKKSYFCGVLFGHHKGPIVRIAAWRGDASRSQGGSLLENVAGEGGRVQRLLSEADGDKSLAGFTPVGWFLARREGSLVLQAPETELYDRLFPEPWQVTLLLRPDQDEGRARFFGRGVQPADTLVLDDGQTGNGSAGKRRTITAGFLWVLALSGWLLLVSLGLTAWLQPGMMTRLLPSSRRVPLRLATGAGGLELAWDHDAVRAFGVWRATLDLRSEDDSKHFELAKDEISSGTFLIAAPLSDTAMEMVFFPDTGTPIHSYARFLVPLTPPSRGANPASANYTRERATRTRVKPPLHTPGEVR